MHRAGCREVFIFKVKELFYKRFYITKAEMDGGVDGRRDGLSARGWMN